MAAASSSATRTSSTFRLSPNGKCSSSVTSPTTVCWGRYETATSSDGSSSTNHTPPGSDSWTQRVQCPPTTAGAHFCAPRQFQPDPAVPRQWLPLLARDSAILESPAAPRQMPGPLEAECHQTGRGELLVLCVAQGRGGEYRPVHCQAVVWREPAALRQRRRPLRERQTGR